MMGRLTKMACWMVALSGSVLPTVGHADAQGNAGAAMGEMGQASGATVQRAAPSAIGSKTVHTGYAAGNDGANVRIGSGILHIDNRTNYSIRIYSNGDYIGTVAPGGDLYRVAGTGTYYLSGKAYFTDGSVSTWGPRTLRVYEDETSTWTLHN